MNVAGSERSPSGRPAAAPAELTAEAFHEHERYLWQVLYRLTGCAADADDLVQETFVRAIEKPPPDLDSSLRPWLVRVGINLGRDHLRRRRRAAYAGPWLPSPVPTDSSGAVPVLGRSAGEELPSYEPGDAAFISAEGRYDLIESVSFAFLLALEVLTPKQRAVLLLRDVFDYSVRETAWALDASEASIKTTLHRARHAMSAYDVDRGDRGPDAMRRTRETLEKFLGFFASGDTRAIEGMLAADVRALSDGGGEYVAARNPIFGPDRVARFATGVRPPLEVIVDARVGEYNGYPAIDLQLAPSSPRYARRVVIGCDLDREGRIKNVYAVLATRKLSEVARRDQAAAS